MGNSKQILSLKITKIVITHVAFKICAQLKSMITVNTKGERLSGGTILFYAFSIRREVAKIILYIIV